MKHFHYMEYRSYSDNYHGSNMTTVFMKISA